MSQVLPGCCVSLTSLTVFSEAVQRRRRPRRCLTREEVLFASVLMQSSTIPSPLRLHDDDGTSHGSPRSRNRLAGSNTSCRARQRSASANKQLKEKQQNSSCNVPVIMAQRQGEGGAAVNARRGDHLPRCSLGSAMQKDNAHWRECDRKRSGHARGLGQWGRRRARLFAEALFKKR